MNGTAITNRLQNSFKIKDNNLYESSSSYYWNFRTSSFKQVACLILTFADKNNNVSCEGMTYSVILVMMFVSTYKTVNILYTCISFHADFFGKNVVLLVCINYTFFVLVSQEWNKFYNFTGDFIFSKKAGILQII